MPTKKKKNWKAGYQQAVKEIEDLEKALDIMRESRNTEIRARDHAKSERNDLQSKIYSMESDKEWKDRNDAEKLKALTDERDLFKSILSAIGKLGS